MSWLIYPLPLNVRQGSYMYLASGCSSSGRDNTFPRVGTDIPQLCCWAEAAIGGDRANCEREPQASTEVPESYYDTMHHGQQFCVGDRVWYRNRTRTRQKKFLKPWCGPWKVLKALSDVTVTSDRAFSTFQGPHHGLRNFLSRPGSVTYLSHWEGEVEGRQTSLEEGGPLKNWIIWNYDFLHLKATRSPLS